MDFSVLGNSSKLGDDSMDPSIEMENVDEAELRKELESFIENVDEKSLSRLEEIIDKELTDENKLNEIGDELELIGLEKKDVEDLKYIADKMTAFLLEVKG